MARKYHTGSCIALEPSCLAVHDLSKVMDYADGGDVHMKIKSREVQQS